MGKRHREYDTVEPAKKKTKKQIENMKISRYNNRVAAGQEMKTFDVGFSTDASTTGAVVQLTTIPTGDDGLTRDGKKIAVKSLHIRCSYSLEDQAVNQKARFLLVHDNAPNQTTFSASNLLSSLTIENFTNPAFFSRFTVLMDKVIVLNQQNSIANNTQKGFFSKYVPVPPKLQLTTYRDGTTDIPENGSFALVYYGDVAAGTTDLDVNGAVRVRFLG